MEEWKHVPGHEDICLINTKGDIKIYMYGHPTMLKRYTTNNGYYMVCIENITYWLHRLVYMTFKGPVPEGMLVCHIDGNKLNNDIDNLELRSASEHYNNKLRCEKISASMTNNKKISKSVICIDNETEYPSINEAARQTGKPAWQICYCCKGKMKTAGGLHWKYKD